MSDHRRKPPQSPGGGRAAARRGAQQQPPTSGGRRAANPPPQVPSPGAPAGDGRSHPGRAAARRAAQGGRRRAENASEGAGVADVTGGSAGGAGGGGRRRTGGGGSGSGPGGRGPARPPKKRFIDYPRWGKTGWRHWMPSWKQVTSLTIAFFGTLVGIAGIAYAMVQVPNVNLSATAQNNVYYWDDNTPMIATGGEINRQIVPIESIRKTMQDAVISAENKTFETDSGVDPMGIARAVKNMATGGEVQGGSTITQQYVKNSRLDQSQTISRKFKELFISIKVGTTLKKSKIMEGYLNTSYFGRGAYGIQAAARTYYGVDSDKLNPSQAAFLAALLKGPTYFDPAGAVDIDQRATPESNTRNSKERWKWILDEEVKDGRLSATDRAKYTEYPMPDAVKKNAQMAGQIGYLVSLAKAYVVNSTGLKITNDDLAKGGYQIHTTFNKKKVAELEASIKSVRQKNLVDTRKDTSGKNTTLDKDGGFVDRYVQFGGASVDPKDGKILAIYGGTDATQHFTNNANETGAQVGSTFKPFVLAAAMTHGARDPKGGENQGDDERTKVSPKSVFSGKNNLVINKYDGTPWINNETKGPWKQPNDDGESEAKVTLREAMEKSMNSPYVQLGQNVGTDKVHDAAVAAGLRKSSTNGLEDYKNSVTYSIGTSSPSAIRMAGAYATFAAHGTQNDPYSVTSVVKDGAQVYKHEKQAKVAFEANVADTVTNVLQGVIKDGTGKPARLEDGREAAGKTGTTDDNKSAWFVGYTPSLSTSIGMWRLDDKATGKGFLSMYGTAGKAKMHGNSFPAQIWHDYMSQALKGTPKQSFEEPSSDPGEVMYAPGTSPTPTPTQTTPTATTPPPTSKAPTTPTTTAPTTPPTSPSASTTTPCSPLDWNCNHPTPPTGGSTSPSATTTPTRPNKGGGGGNNSDSGG
ncbi:transglycosylase domain-containing protein [Streptomyces sp. SPB162]|uniref:transglycosylase domain-containing protein n=1 Tax=Streptomyces sp. SPB162 TaxID=2940560 RepID=UPI0024054D6C|nr:transglycosylase domain-containing protein [Streptomyces sp. SPB162]MDF9814363.1 membrane peptidoglycan carboxypeptidase [Streptomyces sp. SPB162]